MAIVTPTPLYLEDCQITIGTDDYGAAINSVELVPSVSIARFVGLKPDAEWKRADIDWSLNLSYIQDWEAASSLARKLWSAQGSTLVGCTFKPKTGAGPKFTVDLFIVPGSVGGAARAHSVSSVSLGVVGQPDFTYAAE